MMGGDASSPGKALESSVGQTPSCAGRSQSVRCQVAPRKQPGDSIVGSGWVGGVGSGYESSGLLAGLQAPRVRPCRRWVQGHARRHCLKGLVLFKSEVSSVQGETLAGSLQWTQ